MAGVPLGQQVGSTPAVSLSLPEAVFWFTAVEMLRLSSTAATALR